MQHCKCGYVRHFKLLNKWTFELLNSTMLMKHVGWKCANENIGTVCSYHVTHAFQSEYTLYSYLNVKELLAWSRPEIWRLSDCNWTRIHNYFVHKRTLNHLAKVAKRLSCVVSTFVSHVLYCYCIVHLLYSYESWTDLRKFADVIFGITLKLLHIKSSNLVR